MAFWKRKNQDRFISLGITAAPTAAEVREEHLAEAPPAEALAGKGSVAVVTETTTAVKDRSSPEAEAMPIARSPFATSVLGLNLSIEELQAQEAALEQELSARFRRAVAATRD